MTNDSHLSSTPFDWLSGALASALGYILWYRVLREMNAIQASSVQISAPLLAALGGVIWLDEPITSGFVAASVLMLGGIWLVLRAKRPNAV